MEIASVIGEEIARGGRREREFAGATEREFFEQTWLRATDDYKEGVAAMNARREPNFKAR